MVELSECDIQYEPRGSIKGKVYTDFLAELSPGSTQHEEEVGSSGCSRWMGLPISKGVELAWSWRGQTVC